MELLIQALPGILVPAVVAGLGALAGDLLARGSAPRWRVAGAALGAGAGYAAAHRVITGSWAPVPFGERVLTAQHWRSWAALAAGGLGALLGWLGRARSAGGPARLLLAALCLRAVLDARFRHGEPGEAWTWLVGGLLVLALMLVTVERAARSQPGWLLGVELVAVASASALAFQLSRNSSNAQLVGALAATMGGVTALTVLRRTPVLAPGATLVWVTGLAMAWLEGMLYGRLPATAVGLLAAALLALGLERGAGERGPARRLLTVLLVLVLSAVAVAVARSAAPPSAGPYPY